MLESYVGEENAEEKRKAELRDIAVSKSEEQCRSDYSKALIRRLGRSSVNVYRHEYEKLVSAAVVEDYGQDGFGILIQPDAYDPKCGLSTEAEDAFLMI